ncbi:MAG: hypothetical protein EBS54_01435 [Betaproteobacteria bacterium]|nr:hypothetical protein [Betaproteobacteria bacterium]
MAQKPDGKPARTERVTFTKPAAERIAKVVRAVEGGDRNAGPLTFGNRGVAGNPRVFRVCTFTGSWAINATKEVTFRNQTATPNTVAAVNLFFPVASTATSSTDCAIAKDGTAWFLIDVPFETATAVFVRATSSTSVMTDVTLSASLNTSACTISIGKTLVTSSVTIVSSTFTSTFLRFKV